MDFFIFSKISCVIYRSGKLNFMEIFPSPSSLILVGVMPQPRDLEIARVLGWYRIPLRFAPKVVNVDYLAFYQTAAFGEDYRWQIRFFASVRGNELTTRAELFRDQPDHPRANEEYYKIQLGPIQELARPIMADKWKRITFLYTTGELFACARTGNDLVIRSEERQVLWRSLRERAAISGQYQTQEISNFEIDPAFLAMLGDFSCLAEGIGDYLEDS
jgi:hypothetical protein